MNKMLLLLTLILFTSCKQQETRSNEIETSNTVEINLYNTRSFDLVKAYIESVGSIREENVSSILGEERMVTYYEIEFENMLISVDHSDRIYVSKDGKHYGNILKENDKIQAEISYGVPNMDPQLTKAKEIMVLQLYGKLIILASKK